MQGYWYKATDTRLLIQGTNTELNNVEVLIQTIDKGVTDMELLTRSNQYWANKSYLNF